MTTYSLTVLMDFTKAVVPLLDCTNWNAWKSDVVRAYKTRCITHYISVHDWAHAVCKLAKFRRPAPQTDEDLLIAPAHITATFHVEQVDCR